MSTRKISNIPLKDIRKVLCYLGLNCIKTSKGRGGHEKWSKRGMRRPITIQTHIDPVPQFIVSQIIRHLELSRSEFLDALDNM